MVSPLVVMVPVVERSRRSEFQIFKIKYDQRGGLRLRVNWSSYIFQLPRGCGLIFTESEYRRSLL